MNSKDLKKESKKRGFYIALISCFGIVLALGAAVSFRNYLSANKKIESKVQEEQVDFSEMTETSLNQTNSYLTPSDREDVQISVAAAPTYSPVMPIQVTEVVEADVSPYVGESAAVAEDVPTEASTVEVDTAAPEIIIEVPAANIRTENVPTEQVENEEPVTVDIGEVTEEEPLAEERVASNSVFNEFMEGSQMSWPVLGEIVMNFSTSHAIYDKTLDQYRTSDSICISAQAGTQVKASAAGKVISVENTRENGNEVVIDHGNGWSTIYSQLQDGVLVKVGDVVQEGQVIGGVGNPSIYSLLLGNHLEFKIARNDVPMNPIDILVRN